MRFIVVAALQPRAACRATPRIKATINDLRAPMLAYLTAEGRILGLDAGDWALLLGGSALLGLLSLLAV